MANVTISLHTINDINRKLSQAYSLALMIQGDQESNQPCDEDNLSNALWLVQDLISDTKELVKTGIRK